MSVLETLRTARASIAEGPYVFKDWERCTCGHVFYASGASGEPFSSQEAAHLDALQAIRDTFRGAWGAFEGCESLFCSIAPAVSELTYAVASYQVKVVHRERFCTEWDDRYPVVTDEDYRRAALEILDMTIERIEASEAQSVLDVLAQTQAIVDATEMELVPA